MKLENIYKEMDFSIAHEKAKEIVRWNEDNNHLIPFGLIRSDTSGMIVTCDKQVPQGWDIVMANAAFFVVGQAESLRVVMCRETSEVNDLAERCTTLDADIYTFVERREDLDSDDLMDVRSALNDAFSFLTEYAKK
jgi:hypothetical protein